MIFGINTTRDISKLSEISLAQRLVKLRITILKYHSWYLCQISQQIMLLPIQIPRQEVQLSLYFNHFEIAEFTQFKNRFHVAVRLFNNRSQSRQNVVKTKKWRTAGACVTDVFTTF